MNVSLFQDAYLKRLDAFIQSDEINLLVANALRFVIQNIFANVTNAFVTTISTENFKVEFWLNDIMSKLFATWGFMAIQLVVHDYQLKKIEVAGKRYCNLIMVDTFKSLERTNIASYNQNSDSLEYYFIFLQNYDEFIPKEMNLIFRYCFENFWIHCNVMIQTAKGEVFIYTYFPFEERNCFQTRPQLINQFKGNRFVDEVMFPDKLKDLHKCPLKVTTWEVPPFVMNKTYRHFPTPKLSGFEILIILAISRDMNFTLDVNMIPIDTYSENENPISVSLGKLKNRETNITMGYFRRTAEMDIVATPSYVTYYLPLMAVILRRQMEFETISIFTYPFDKTTWTLILLVYGVVALINVFNTKKYRIKNFKIYEIAIGVPIRFMSRIATKRILFLTMLLSSYILRSVYQSLLFHLFRTHFYKTPPVTIEGLIEHGYEAICNEMSLHFVINVPQIKDHTLPLLLINSSDELHPFLWLEFNRNKKYAVISIYDLALFYANEILSSNDVLQILPINVNDQHIGFYFVQHSYLAERFNNYILYFQQAGLLKMWKEFSNLEHQLERGDSTKTHYEDILMVNLKQLIGIFFMLIFLYLISIALFVLELLSNKSEWLKQFFA